MADLFSTVDINKLFENKKIMFLGDSNIRALYKDFVMLSTKNRILDAQMLKKKGERSHMGDSLIEFRGLLRTVGYVEKRKFKKYENNVEIEFTFITNCLAEQVQVYTDGIKRGSIDKPDVLIMNSTLWDISRYANGFQSFKENIVKLVKLLKSTLTERTLFIWVTAFPVSSKIGPSILTKNLMKKESCLRFEIMGANMYCRQLFVSHGFNVLDAHFYLKMNLHTRDDDGIHYCPNAIRLVTLLLLTHISLSWNVPLPGNFTSAALDRVKRENVVYIRSEKSQIPRTLYPLSEKRVINNKKKIIKWKVKPPAPARLQQNKMISRRENIRYQPYKKKNVDHFLPKTEEVPSCLKQWPFLDNNNNENTMDELSTPIEFKRISQSANEISPWAPWRDNKSSNVVEQQQQTSYTSLQFSPYEYFNSPKIWKCPDTQDSQLLLSKSN